ncbi:MAG TPA: hypothetical protein VMY06_02440 [Sedimentisphaerales bacterium]|nr:hypothetical protein [Sedimentisphaerales bacterium]
MRRFHSTFVEVGHSVELDRPTVRNGQGVANGTAAAPATANKGQADSVVSGSEGCGRETPEYGRASGERTTLFQKLSTVDFGLVDGLSHVCLLG